MTTGSVSHTHTVSIANKSYTTSAFAHSHSETPDPDAAAIADLQARVAALESAGSAKVVPFTPSGTAAQLLALLADNTVDVVELNGGYHLSYTIVDIDRTRPVDMRPAPGATVTFYGDQTGGSPQFWFGLNARAGNINMHRVAFDGFVLNQQGIIQARNVHDLDFSDITVRNSRCNGTTAQPYHSWAVYLAGTPTLYATDVVFDRWTVQGNGRLMSGLAIDGGNHVYARGWDVSHLFFAAHANSAGYGPIADCLLDDWDITDCGSNWSPAASVDLESAAGVFSNLRASGSAGLINVGTPRMTDGGGNVWA